MLRVSPWPGAEVHGGQLRSQQVASLVARALPDAVQFTADHPRSLSRSALAAVAARGATAVASSRGRLSEAFYTAWVDSIVAAQRLRRGDLVIFDADPRYGPALTRVATRRGLRVVALPHNIEAVLPKAWPIAVDPARVGTALAAEMRWLAAATAVWTIGTLDRELCELFGIAAGLLPYAPPAPRAADLAAIRARRMTPGSASGPLLIIGTVHNPPTRAGMTAQLALARTLGDALPPLVVAGYGTEALAGEAGPGVSVLGALDWPALQELLVSAKALWVHQTPMSGALTRISEALVAGVPVLANRWAARGHGVMAGLVSYGDEDGPTAALAALPAQFPPPDFSAAEAAFIAGLRALAS